VKLVFEVKDVEAERSRLESLGIQTLRRPWQKAGEACDDRRVRLLMESRPPLELGAATQDLNPRSEGRQIRGHIGLKLGVEMSVIEIISFVLIEAVLRDFTKMNAACGILSHYANRSNGGSLARTCMRSQCRRSLLSIDGRCGDRDSDGWFSTIFR